MFKSSLLNIPGLASHWLKYSNQGKDFLAPILKGVSNFLMRAAAAILKGMSISLLRAAALILKGVSVF